MKKNFNLKSYIYSCYLNDKHTQCHINIWQPEITSSHEVCSNNHTDDEMLDLNSNFRFDKY